MNSKTSVMKSLLLLICTLFSKALSLTCHVCVEPLGTCGNTTCPDYCVTAATSLYMSGSKFMDINVKTCSSAELCINGSMNLGMMKMVNNAKCCSNDLCNSDTLPAPQKQTPNGRMCYTCNANDCTGKISCEGNEDRCITASVQFIGNIVSMKGCASKSFCQRTGLSDAPEVNVTSVKCCQGNLCNGAERFTLSFLLMFIPLLSSILFY